ncbi:MAG: CpXC domain-containing protein, partial [Anaerolineales bacterium]
MPAKMTTIQCPQCKTPVPTRLEQIIDVSDDPGAKNRLLSNALNHVHCSVCGHAGQLAVPLVYHDAEKELLLAYIPVELGMKKDDQERALGQLINQVIDKLPAEQRKGYLLQPQTMLTRQSMIERILEADGITKEEIEAQRARVRLFEELLRTPEEGLQAFVTEHDAEMDEVFFQLASLSLRTTADQAARESARRRLDSALALTSVGKR